MKEKPKDALLVTGGKILQVVVRDLEDMQRHIGGYIESCFRIDLPGGLSIDAYCDEEYRLKNNIDWNVVVHPDLLWGSALPVGGPILIIGGDNRTGESRSLTYEEKIRFKITTNEVFSFMKPKDGPIRAMPTLVYTDDTAARDEEDSIMEMPL